MSTGAPRWCSKIDNKFVTQKPETHVFPFIISAMLTKTIVTHTHIFVDDSSVDKMYNIFVDILFSPLVIFCHRCCVYNSIQYTHVNW